MIVLLGQPSWDDKVKPYFKSENANSPNKIREYIADWGLQSLLVYNGLDALLEFKAALIQAEQLGIPIPERA